VNLEERLRLAAFNVLPGVPHVSMIDELALDGLGESRQPSVVDARWCRIQRRPRSLMSGGFAAKR